ncbi:hypothetical protein FDP41_002310 [Naegleria fowleri]|uniref:F-box domain-containing protein n=1 Tax=Naegleria fowleri TaxID=5763 RepID=A0A6A5BY34_NAEFO|nr:uncharacterized protein FDP41_002310 [Naegleria fowleri]KAF0978490.1 hypothetical protein FDP41_002310 [Naegleria fowleri]CAG4718487.1 unnamed protein product [Naegleria fowleri]
MIITDLHSDLIFHVLSYLEGREVLNVRQCSHLFYDCYMDHRKQIWRNLLRHVFPTFFEKVKDYLELSFDSSFRSKENIECASLLLESTERKEPTWIDYFDLYFKALLHSELKGNFTLNVLNPLKVADGLSEKGIPNSPSTRGNNQPLQSNSSSTLDFMNQILPVSYSCFMKKFRNLEGYLPNNNVLSRLTVEERSVLDAMTNKKKYLLFSRFNDPTFSLVDVENRQIVKKFTGHKGTVLDIKCLFMDPFNLKSKNVGSGTFYLNTTSSSFNNRIISASSDQTIKIWNFTTGNLIESLTEHKGSVVSIESMSENIVTSASHDLSIKFWDINVGKCIYTLSDVHERLLYKIQYNPWNHLLSSCGKDGKVKIFDARAVAHSQKPIKVLEHKKDGNDELLSVYSIAMNSHSISCGGKDGLFTIFDLRKLSQPLLKQSYTSPVDRIYCDELKVTLFEAFSCKVIDLLTLQEKTINELENRQATYCVSLGSELFIDYGTMVTQIDNQDLCLVDFH